MGNRQTDQRFKYSWKELLTTKVHIEEVVSKRILVKGTKMLLAGPPKVRKTTLITQLMYEIANGLPALCTIDVPKPRKVLVFSLEDSEATLSERVQRIQREYKTTNIGPYYVVAPVMPLTTKDGLAFAEACIADVKPDVVVYDPLYKVNIESENDAVALQRTLNTMDEIAYEHKLTTVLVHHTNKPAFDSLGRVIDRGFGAIRGSIALLAWPDTIALMFERNKSLWLDLMLRHGASPPPIELTFTDSGIFSAKLPSDGNSRRTGIAGVLAKEGPLSTDELALRMGVTPQYVRTLVQPLEEEGVVSRKRSTTDKRSQVWALKGADAGTED